MLLRIMCDVNWFVYFGIFMDLLFMLLKCHIDRMISLLSELTHLWICIYGCEYRTENAIIGIQYRRDKYPRAKYYVVPNGFLS